MSSEKARDEASARCKKSVLCNEHFLIMLNIVKVEGEMFSCNLCHTNASHGERTWLRSSGSSSNIFTHLALRHPKSNQFITALKNFRFEKSKSPLAPGQSTIEVSLRAAQKTTITDATTLLVAQLGLPPRMFESEPMKDFVRSINPSASLPTRNTLKRKLDTLYESVLQQMEKELSEARGLCVCVDGWSDPNRTSFQGGFGY